MSELNATDILLRLKALESGSADTADGLTALGDSATQIWVLLAGFLVFWMHAGFMSLETGSVRHKNAVNIMFKNLGTVCISGVLYYLFGYAFAFGEANAGNNSHKFIGSGDYALSSVDNDTRNFWFFQFAFAATGATIISGAVAGRVNLIGYFLVVVVMVGFVYPVVSHWVWAEGGWISAFQPDGVAPIFSEAGGCGMVDYAGSGVVHMTGGIAAFWGAFFLGPRLGRFDADGRPLEMRPHNIGMQTLGVFILWFGWYGFNCGSTLAFDGANASKVAVTTTLSPSMAVVTAMVYSHFVLGHFDIGVVLNSALAGLVGITAGCSVVPDWAALIIGFVASLLYVAASAGLKRIQVDDPVDAIAVHGICGVWGVLAVGIFATTEFLDSAYGGCDWKGNTSGIQFATQLVGVLAIFGWVTLIMVPTFLGLKAVNLLRVSAEMETRGLDVSEHGGQSAFIHLDDEVKDSVKGEPQGAVRDVAQV